jgi:hypothetical protein
MIPPPTTTIFGLDTAIIFSKNRLGKKENPAQLAGFSETSNVFELLLGFNLRELSLGVSIFAKEICDLVIVGHLFCLAFAVVAAESNGCTFEFDCEIFLDFTTREWARLLFNLLGSDQLMICLCSKVLFVVIKLLEAIAAAEVNLAVFPIARLVFLYRSSGNEALQLIDSDFGISRDTDCGKRNHERKQTDDPRIFHLGKLHLKCRN